MPLIRTSVTQKRKPNSIEEIRIYYLVGEEWEIEPRIENLVRVLCGVGLATWSSCEGHLASGKDPYPNVRGNFTWLVNDLEDIIDIYNLHGAVRWSIEKQERIIGGSEIWVLRPTTYATTPKELEVLQASAENLAHWLFDTYVRFRELPLRMLKEH